MSYLRKMKRALAASEISEESEKSHAPESAPAPLLSLNSHISQPEQATASTIPDLDAHTLAAHLGLDVPPYAAIDTINNMLAEAVQTKRVDPEAVTDVHKQVGAAVRALGKEIATGKVDRHVRLIHGRPLADWLGLDVVVRLLGRA